MPTRTSTGATCSAAGRRSGRSTLAHRPAGADTFAVAVVERLHPPHERLDRPPQGRGPLAPRAPALRPAPRGRAPVRPRGALGGVPAVLRSDPRAGAAGSPLGRLARAHRSLRPRANRARLHTGYLLRRGADDHGAPARRGRPRRPATSRVDLLRL